MWTGIGIIFSIIIIGFPIVKWGLVFIVGAGVSTKGRSRAQKELDLAYAEKEKQDDLNRNRIMSQEYRLQKIEVEPVSISVGEKTVTKNGQWINGLGYQKVTTTEPARYYWKQEREPFSYNGATKTQEKGYTFSLYEYISKVEFLDDRTEEEWCDDNRIRKRDEYLTEREKQCRQYCKAVSQLAHRYICFIGYDEFKEAFIRVLMQDKKLIIAFMKECQAADEWKKEYNQVYDCENYMHDFMKENHIQEKVNEFAGHEVRMPTDFRVYRKNTPEYLAARHIEHELEKRGWDISAATSEVKSTFWWGAVFVSSIISIVVLWLCIASPVNYDNVSLRRFLLIICFFMWTFFIVMAGGHTGNSERIKKAKVDEQNYWNGFPNHANLEGMYYADELTKKIMQHPLPYKYYSKGEQENGRQDTTRDQGQNGTVTNGLHS